MEDVNGDKKLKGKKKVFWKNLNVKLIEDSKCMLVKNDDKKIGERNGKGRRVEMIECKYWKIKNGKFVYENYENNRNNVDV